jgi:hypothetical protein
VLFRSRTLAYIQTNAMILTSGKPKTDRKLDRWEVTLAQ